MPDPTLVKSILAGTAAGLPIGAGLAALMNKIRSMGQQPATSPEVTYDFPVSKSLSPGMNDILTNKQAGIITGKFSKYLSQKIREEVYAKRMKMRDAKIATEDAVKEKDKLKNESKEAAIANPQLSAMIAGLASAPAGYKLTELLMDKSKSKKLEQLIGQRSTELNDLLIQEQEGGAIGKVASEEAIEKIAGAVYDGLVVSSYINTTEKSASRLGDIPGMVSKSLGLEGNKELISLAKLVALGAGAGGLATGYAGVAAKDPKRKMHQAASKALDERLATSTGTSPMHIRMRAPAEAVRPASGRRSALTDPLASKDVLMNL